MSKGEEVVEVVDAEGFRYEVESWAAVEGEQALHVFITVIASNVPEHEASTDLIVTGDR